MSEYSQALREAVRFIRDNDRFLVISHVSPDGDTTGSALAMVLLLKQSGKSCRIVNEGKTPAKFGFLPGFEAIVDLSRQPLDETFTHVIAVDAADSMRMGNVQHLFAPGAQILNIDHHPTNDRFGVCNVIRADAAATAEIMYDLIEAGGFAWDRDLATCVYTGLLTDTGGFRYSNTTPRVMEIASNLLRYGVNPGEIADRCLEAITVEHVRLLSRVLPTLTLTHRNQVASMKIRHADLLETRAGSDDISGVVNYGRNIEGVEVGLLFTEVKPGTIKVGLRSRSRVDVAQIAKSLGGGGHARAAGCTITGELDRVADEVLAKISEQLGVSAHE